MGDLVEGVDELWWFGDVEVGVQAEQVDGEHVRGGRAEQPTPRTSPPWWPTSPGPDASWLTGQNIRADGGLI
ncbi:MAG TPA: hypothetical protein VF003_01685 [Pseudonocardiaceae bacterium]